MTVRAIRVGDHVRTNDGAQGIVTQCLPGGLSTMRRDDGVTGGGFERGWLFPSGSATLLPRKRKRKRSIYRPPERFGPFKPIPKALP
jgi:hypothetical protein